MPTHRIFGKKNRALLRELVATDFKLRYQGSALGYLWSLLRPLFLFAILYVVFGHFLRLGRDIEHFPLYLLLGIVLWGFFVEATMQGLSAIVGRGDLIRKVNFPKYIIVISGTLSAFINLCLNLFVVGFFMYLSDIDVRKVALLFPLIIAELYVFALALAFLLSALFVRYRDINYVWEVGVQAAFYATPVLYPLSMVLEKNEFAARMLLLNPIAQIIQDARYTLITRETDTLYGLTTNALLMAIPFALIALVVVFAVYYFRRNSRYFAENV